MRKPRVVSPEGRDASAPLWQLVDEYRRLAPGERKRRYSEFSAALNQKHRSIKAQCGIAKHDPAHSRFLTELGKQAQSARAALLTLEG